MKFSRLILANLLRKKSRLLLTIGSFAVALFLFALLGVVDEAFGRGADVVSANRLVTINRTSIINPIPLSYRDDILRIPGVKYITHDNWFGVVYQDPKNFFPQFVIDPENQRQVFPELIVPDDQWNTFLKDRQGAIVGAAISAAHYVGWWAVEGLGNVVLDRGLLTASTAIGILLGIGTLTAASRRSSAQATLTATTMLTTKIRTTAEA